MIRRLLLALLMVCTVLPAQAHQASDAYLWLRTTTDGVALRWDIPLRDLDLALDLDTDRDGALTWGELRARHAEIEALAARSLSLRTDAGPCTAGTVSHQVDEHADLAHAVLTWTARCPGAPQGLALSYTLFAELDSTHRGLLRQGAEVRPLVPDGAWVPVSPDAGAGGLAAFARFVGSGLHHILIGWDHLAFLGALLLPAVLVRRERRWQPGESLRASLLQVGALVSAFTVAHSITLALAVMGLLMPPARLVESVIAASVCFAAADNLVPLVRRHRLALVFGFGLVHGFGFAGVLAEIGLHGEALLPGLLGFNLGVEAGQLLVVALLLPLIWALRHHRLYAGLALPAASVLLFGAGLLWFLERALDWPVFG